MRLTDGRIARLAAVSCVAVIGASVAASSSPAKTRETGGTLASSGFTPVERIVRNPARFYAVTVRVRARVSRWIDHRVWEMAGGRLFMIKDRGVDPAPRPPERFRIIGTVYPMEPAIIEGRLGINIEDHFFADDFLDDDVAVVVRAYLRADWPVPLPAWFWRWARWYLDRGEFEDDGRFRSSVDRPEAAPRAIPAWGWSRLVTVVDGWKR